MEENLTLSDLIKIFKQRILLILSLMIIGILIAVAFSHYVLTPEYESSTQILVNHERSDANTAGNTNIETDLQLINTYSDIIKSPVILDKVIKELNIDLTANQLNKKITVSSNENSQVINVSVKNEDPQVAIGIANITAKVFQTEIQNLMAINNVSVLTPAILQGDGEAISPHPFLILMIGAIIGLLIGYGIAVILSSLDNTLKSDDDVISFLDIPVVGVISPILEKEKVLSAPAKALIRKETKIYDKNEEKA